MPTSSSLRGLPEPACGREWPGAVVVAIPTVARRRAPLAATLRQWAAVGADPMVRLQPGDWLLCHESHRRNVDDLLREVLSARGDATHVVLSEDDVDVDPAIVDVISGLMAEDRVVALMVAGTARYPRAVRESISAGEPIPRQTVRIRPSSWFGTQGILMPVSAVRSVVDHESARAGWDMHLRDWMVARRVELRAVVPNLVQHRGVPSMVGSHVGMLRSATYLWPTE